MNKDTMISRNPELIVSQIDGEFLMMGIENNAYYHLNEIGSAIWSLLEDTQSIKTICQSLTQSYRVDIETCEKDIVPFIGELVNENVLRQE
ncbi:Coenzyme PQQ synthesis protein D [BD1-7 clade bacterium]|uniref:Coenzyme PQQ synthesis protein D n=1 Tax=BD1-7 clade bacterium TaxID=2029982 RepID=A0A5S9PJE8_9GAMM|nr:Coenzyme PQQ synthesis protein D [BD1-7 clade bacterium]